MEGIGEFAILRRSTPYVLLRHSKNLAVILGFLSSITNWYTLGVSVHGVGSVGSGDFDLRSSDRHELRLHEPSPVRAVRSPVVPTLAGPVSGAASRRAGGRGRGLTGR